MKKTFGEVFTAKGITGICAACALVAGFMTNLTTIMSSAAKACSTVGICSEAPPKIAVRIANLDQNSMMHLLYGDNIKQDIASWASISRYTKRENEICLEGSPMDRCGGKHSITTQNNLTFDPGDFNCENGVFGSGSYVSEKTAYGGGWSPGIPILDLLSIGGTSPALIAQLRVESKLIELDKTPYVQVAGIWTDLASVELVKHSDSQLSSLTIDYNIVLKSPENIDLSQAWSFHKRLPEMDLKRLDKSAVQISFVRDIFHTVASAKFSPSKKWGPETKNISGIPDNEVWAVGVIKATSKDGKPFVSTFRNELYTGDPPELGGGLAPVDYFGVIILDPDEGNKVYTRDLSISLLPNSPTIRSQIALLSRKSAIYDVRFSYYGLSLSPVIQSPWIRIQTFTSPHFASQYFHQRCL